MPPLWADVIEWEEEEEEERRPPQFFKCEICGTRFKYHEETYSNSRGDFRVCTCPDCGTVAWSEPGYNWADPGDG